MIRALRLNWRLYLIEAWALGMFMLSAVVFTILIEHPSFPIRTLIQSGFERRVLIGLAMGITVVLLMYSSWGEKSGAHMNPAVTLTFLILKRISRIDALFYITAQFIGGLLAVESIALLIPSYIHHPDVNYTITVPGKAGNLMAFLYEFSISFVLIGVVLLAGNSNFKKYTGYFAGFLLLVYISFEAPYSGMSINPARTIASAIPSNNYTALWIYFVAPVGGMLMAGLSYRAGYIWRKGNCKEMMLHLNGKCEESISYLPGL